MLNITFSFKFEPIELHKQISTDVENIQRDPSQANQNIINKDFQMLEQRAYQHRQNRKFNAELDCLGLIQLIINAGYFTDRQEDIQLLIFNALGSVEPEKPAKPLLTQQQNLLKRQNATQNITESTQQPAVNSSLSLTR